MFSKRHGCAYQDRSGLRHAAPHPGSRRGRQRRPQARYGTKSLGRAGRKPAWQDRRRTGTDIQAEH